jgi:hypothetical protein
MPGRLRREGCLKPGQTPSASPSARGPLYSPRSRSPRRLAGCAAWRRPSCEDVSFFRWPTGAQGQLLRRSQNEASTSQQPVPSGRFQVAAEQEEAIKSVAVG